MSERHEAPLLGAYALGVLDDDEVREVEAHLAGCAPCRAELAALEETRTTMGELPPEALLDGPPDDGDLLLQRTLRQVRVESARGVTRTRLVTGVAAAVVIGAVLGGGVLIGRSTSDQVAGQGPPPTTTVAPPPSGTKVVSGSGTSGAAMAAKIVPAAGWVRVNASVTGIPAGQRCRLVVVGKDGTRETAGSWLVSPKGAAEGTNLDGAAIVAPDDVAAVEVENTDGAVFVSVKV